MKGSLLVNLANQPFTPASSEKTQLLSATPPVPRYLTLHKAGLQWDVRDTRKDCAPSSLPHPPDLC